jgi:hypothetical protein
MEFIKAYQQRVLEKLKDRNNKSRPFPTPINAKGGARTF